MKEELLVPFTNATCQTLKMLLDVDALAESADCAGVCSDEAGRISVAIGLTGDISGEALYRFRADTSLEIVKIMSGMEFTEIDEFVTSALGEIANIISGNAATDLTNSDITCDILPPRIFEGGELPSHDETTYVFSTKINTPIGEVEVSLRVQAE
ncbi:MAG TPA: chemotaxis protein CheX [Bacillota bacterium]|nr:chemotaxis protein CheX [Bacillota bacterium]